MGLNNSIRELSLLSKKTIGTVSGSSFSGLKEYRTDGLGSRLFVCSFQGLKNRWTWLVALRLQNSMIKEPVDMASGSSFAVFKD